MENKPVVIPVAMPTDTGKTDQFLEGLLKQYPQYFDSILQNRREWNVQIIYTQVNRGKNGVAELQNHYFNIDASRYFYQYLFVSIH